MMRKTDLDDVQDKVHDMVNEQLRAACFDPDLSAGQLSTLRATSVTASTSYAAAAKLAPTLVQRADKTLTQIEGREDRFWECRRSLRLWPVNGDSRDALCEFLG